MIEAIHLEKTFGSHPVLSGVSLQIPEGESLVIIGRSGGGKSVLIKHLIGLIQPDRGDIRIDGTSIIGMSERDLLKVRRKFAMVFQGAALFDSMTVSENISFALRRHEVLTEGEIAARVDKALEMVDLQGTHAKKPAELSGGMRKRVGLARAIIYEPEIILYDEPTTGLDPVVSDSIDRLMMRVNEQINATTVTVTHDMRSARRIGNHLCLLHEGRIHISGTPEEVFDSKDPVVHHFVNGISEPKDAFE